MVFSCDRRYILLCTSANEPGNASGKLPLRSERKQGLRKQEPASMPFLAVILIEGIVWCTGSIVHERWVLTSAMCVTREISGNHLIDVNFIKVRVGTSRGLRGGQLVSVTKVVRHPDFCSKGDNANIALLKLEDQLKLSKKVQLVNIHEGNEPAAQSSVTFGGWGRTEVIKCVMKTQLKVDTWYGCFKRLMPGSHNSKNQDLFCGVAPAIPKGPFKYSFDEGAPAVQNNSLVGVMSSGFYPKFVFNKAQYFRNFVKSTISES